MPLQGPGEINTPGSLPVIADMLAEIAPAAAGRMLFRCYMNPPGNFSHWENEGATLC